MQSLFGIVLNPATWVVFAALLVLSLMSLSVVVFKVAQFARIGVGHRDTAERILDTWLSGKSDEAVKLAAERRTVLARVLQAVFTGVQAKPDNTAYAEELGRQTAIIEMARMTERMRVLEMVVQAAPMLGLLGTVIGMIDAFSVLSVSEGGVNPAALAGGIWTALTTTALGLAIALVAYFFATWFESRIDRERNLIEAAVSAAIHGRVDPDKAG